jgi:YggT family protein
VNAALDLAAWLLEVYVLILIAYALMSWFPVSTGSGLEKAVVVLSRICEPVLRPVRRVLPPVRVGGTAIDLSVIIVIIAAEILVTVLR